MEGMKAEAARCCDIQLEAFRDHRRHLDQDIYDAIARAAAKTKGELETAIHRSAQYVKADARREADEAVAIFGREVYRSIDVPGHVDHTIPEESAGSGGEKYLYPYLQAGFRSAKVDVRDTNRAVDQLKARLTSIDAAATEELKAVQAGAVANTALLSQLEGAVTAMGEREAQLKAGIQEHNRYLERVVADLGKEMKEAKEKHSKDILEAEGRVT